MYNQKMSTITITKSKYESLKKQAAAYRKIISVARVNLFKSPPTRDAEKMVIAMKETGRYPKKFLDSLARGLARSSYFTK